MTRLHAIVLALALGWLALPATAQDGATADWSGTWETRWRDGGARVILEQEGGTVTGLYPLFDGRIEAEASGRELRGRWVQEDRAGGFVFVQSQDGRSFTGRFDSGEGWTGARAATRLVNVLPVDQSSPMAAMRSFLTAANQAADGTLDALGAAVEIVQPSEGADDPIGRFEHARAARCHRSDHVPYLGLAPPGRGWQRRGGSVAGTSRNRGKCHNSFPTGERAVGYERAACRPA